VILDSICLGTMEDWSSSGADGRGKLLEGSLLLGCAVLNTCLELSKGDLASCLVLHLSEDQIDVSGS